MQLKKNMLLAWIFTVLVTGAQAMPPPMPVLYQPGDMQPLPALARRWNRQDLAHAAATLKG